MILQKYVVLFFLLSSSGIINSQEADIQKKINLEHPNARMHFYRLDSPINKIQKWLDPFKKELDNLGHSRYSALELLILEKSIPEIQTSIKEKQLTYEELTLFYLYRIRLLEQQTDTPLNSIISIHPDCLKEAKSRDKMKNNGGEQPLLFGMPILVKDNINTSGVPTTAGAEVLKNNLSSDAFIISNLKKQGAIILGKTNLSEWAYFFCEACPLGYSAMGGQTMNPYGPMKFESGGSSSGSAVAVSANLAVAAIATETSGSILSPSSLNAVVGMKPTVGSLSRSGIIPISSTLDTPGPIAKNAVDMAILYNGMLGKDTRDSSSFEAAMISITELNNATLMNKRIGVIRSLLEDSIYGHTIDLLEGYGAEIVAIDLPSIELNGFITLLNQDMKLALPMYLKNDANSNVEAREIEDIIEYNNQDPSNRAPYGQKLFENMVNDKTNFNFSQNIKNELLEKGKRFFASVWEQNLDAIVSIDNRHAAYAALGFNPCIVVPMGYKNDGQPTGLTFIGQQGSDSNLLKLAHAFEIRSGYRKPPKLTVKTE
jgi:amidase